MKTACWIVLVASGLMLMLVMVSYFGQPGNENYSWLAQTAAILFGAGLVSLAILSRAHERDDR